MKYWDAICPVCGHELKLLNENIIEGDLIRTLKCNNCIKEIIIIDRCSLKMKTLDDFGE